MVDAAEEMVLSDFQTGNSLQTCRHYIQRVMFLLQRLIVFNNILAIDGEKTKARALGVLHLDDGTISLSGIKKQPILVLAASKYVQFQ